MEILRKANRFESKTIYGSHYPKGMIQTYYVSATTLQILKEKGLIVNSRIYTESEILTRELEITKLVQEAKSNLLGGGTWKGALSYLSKAAEIEKGNITNCWQITYAGRKLVEEFETLLPQEPKGDL